MATVINKLNLQGKVAIVTGGSMGIGRAVALGLAEAGADVVVASRKLPDLEEVAKEITGLGRRSLPIAAHMGRKGDIDNLVRKTMEEFGRIDILVNNAVTNPVVAPVLDIEERTWDHIIGVNLKGYFLLSQAVGRIMVKQKGGNIINVASESSFRPSPGLAVYCISKAGVVMLTKALAKELGQYNIRVNSIAPGFTKTRFSQDLWTDPDHVEQVVGSQIVLGRIGKPEDMVGTVLHLVSEASSYLTGQTILIDGGLTI